MTYTWQRHVSRVANHQKSEIIRTLSLVKNITHTVLSRGGRGQRIFPRITWISGGDGGGVSRHTNEVGGERVEILGILHGLMGVSGKFTSVKPIESAVYKPQEMYFTPWTFIWPVNNQGSRENSEIFNTLIPKILTLNFRLILLTKF